MLKKEEVYVRVSSEKKARKLGDLLEMFGENVYGKTLERLKNGIVSDKYPYVSYSFDSWHGLTHVRTFEYLTEVTLKELRNILAKEKQPQESAIYRAISLLQHGLGLDYSHEVIQGLEKLKNK